MQETCKQQLIFSIDPTEIDTYSYIHGTNEKDTCAILFLRRINKGENFQILRYTPDYFTMNVFHFKLVTYSFDVNFEFQGNPKVKAFSFLDDFMEVLTLLVIYTHTQIFVAPINETKFFEPVFRNYLLQDIYLNKSYLMLFDLNENQVEFVDFLGDSGFFRKIWPPLDLELIGALAQVEFVDDFILARTSDHLNEFVNIKISNGNPVVISKYHGMDIARSQLAYLKVEDSSFVCFGITSHHSISCTLNSSVLSFQLNLYKNDFLDAEQMHKNLEFPFNLSLHTLENYKFLHRFKIKIPSEYNIRKNAREITKVRRRKSMSINLSKLFRGNIYFFDFSSEQEARNIYPE